MSEKVYLWCFPGLGKSSVHSHLSIADADCERFKYIFPGSAPKSLHQSREWEGVTRDPSYPGNYLDYVQSVKADVVLLNCHISLLEQFDKEKLILIFPSADLKPEYLNRYARRGDNESYISYMKDSFEDMVRVIQCSPYRKQMVSNPHIYLQDLLDGGKIMSQFITKPELSKLFEECIQHGIYAPITNHAHSTPDELAQRVFEGEIEVDIDSMKTKLNTCKKEIAQEQLLSQRRGGLTRDELADKIMQGIVNGALGIRYAEIAPYSHGYEVTFGGNSQPGSTRNFSNRWECYNGDLFSVPYKVADAIAAGRQSDAVFGAKCAPLDIQKMLQSIEDAEHRKLLSFTPESQTDFVRATNSHTYPYRNSVASVMDVHAGKGLDGIVQHHYHGDYSTITPSNQNSLVETLVCLKGFCLDCVNGLDIGPGVRQKVIEYLKAHGTDISTPEKLKEWIISNPDKCALASNRTRKPSLETVMNSAGERAVASKGALAKETEHSLNH